MTPSGGDIDITFNPQSLIENFRKVTKAAEDMVKGIAGAPEKFNKVFGEMSQQITTVTQRATRAQETYVRSIERQAAAYGRSGVEKLIAQRDFIIAKYSKEKDVIERVTAAYQKMIQVEQQETRRPMEASVAALERRAAAFGQTGAQKMITERDELIRSLGNEKQMVDRVTASYEKMIQVERQEAAVAKERELQALERQAGTAGKSRVEQLQMRRDEDLAASAGDTEAIRRKTTAYEKLIQVEQREAAQTKERSVKALEDRAELAGKSRVEQLVIAREREIKALGQDAEAVKRVTAAYSRLITVEEEEERKRKSGSGIGGLLFRGGRDIFEGRMAYGTMDIGRAALGAAGVTEGGGLAGLTGGAAVGLGLGATAAAFGAVAITSMKAAESVGNYAQQIHNLQAESGMTVKEVQQFEFVTKVTGQDVSSLQQILKGLTEAVTATGEKGQKSRQTLQGMGVDVLALRNGFVPLPKLLDQIGAALERQPNLWERNAEAVELLHRAGIRNIAMLEDYRRLIHETEDMHFMSDEDQQKFQRLHEDMAQFGEEWDHFILHVKETLAQPFYMFVKFVKETEEDNIEYNPITGQPQIEPYTAGAHKYPGAYAPLERQYQTNIHIMTSDHPPVEYTRRQEGGMDVLEERASTTRKEYLEAYNDRTKYRQEQVDSLRAIAESAKRELDSARRAESDQKNIAEALRHAREQAEQRKEDPFALPAQLELDRALRMHGIKPGEAAEFRRIYQDQIKFQGEQRTKRLGQQMLEVQETTQRELGRARLGGITPVNIRELGQGGVTRADVERDIVEQYQQRVEIAKDTRRIEENLINKREIDPKNVEGLAQKARDLEAAAGKEQVANAEATLAIKREALALAQKDRDEERRHIEEMSRIKLADQEEAIRHDADLARKRAELRFKGDSPAAGIAESYRIAVEEARRIYELETSEEIKAVAEKRISVARAEEDQARAISKLHREDEAAREDAEYKLLQMQQKQLDTLKGKIEPLYQTLFTDPKKFGTQLRSTIQEASLHPIVSGLSEMTARALHPLVYGAGGTGGIAGAFGEIFGGGGGGLKDLKLTARKAVPVEVVGGPSPSPGGGWTGPMGGWGPGGTPGFVPGSLGLSGGGGGWSGPMGGWGPSGTSVYTGGYDGGGGTGMGGGGYWPSPWGTGPGGTPGFAPGSLGLSSGGTYGGGLRGIAGVGRGLLQNLRVMLGQAKPYVHGETMGQESLNAVGAEGMGSKFSWSGLGKSPLARAGAGTVGMMLAQAGILGNQRGTGYGVLEGTFGGAGVGFAMGGPLGAAIGAGVGLGISMGEVIAGVESPRNEAKRLVTSLYHVSVNNSTADQIVNIANQSYGGHVSVAVRSPEVRHMLGLYAAGTGQAGRFAMGATEAHGASLVESGGSLSQQATYQYGQAYSYGSPLPVYGGVSTHSLAAPGGNLALSLNIDGQDAAKFLTGNVVSPEIVQSQYASAMSGSAGRVPQALMMSSPGTIAS